MFPKVVMQHKYLIAFGLIVVFFAALFLQYYWKIEVESFDVVPIQFADAQHTKLLSGYYQVDAKNMAHIPYGYKLDPTNNSKIVPVTATAQQSTTGKVVPPVPPMGKRIPDTYYLLNATSLAILPPNMMPNVKSVDVSYTTVPPTLLVYYDKGYISSTQYYQKMFPTPDSVKSTIRQSKTPPPAPPTMYFVDPAYKTIAFLPYGKIQDRKKGYGYIDNPNLISKTGKFDAANTNFKDIANDIDINYHQSAEDLMANSKSSDVKFSKLKVKDQNGNTVQIPYSSIQGTATYYQPGSFPFGASTYVPKYEDSVYLSRTTNESTVSKYTPLNGGLGACEKNKNLPAQNEEYCRSLNSSTCSSTSCCVLLGGSKCVAGNERGPIYKNNYGDYLVRNKDSYYYNGKCYGNCV